MTGKIQLTEPGFTSFTGQMGNVWFTNGVSNYDVSEEQMAGIAATMRVEHITDAGISVNSDITGTAVIVEDLTGEAGDGWAVGTVAADSHIAGTGSVATENVETNPGVDGVGGEVV